MVNIYEGVDADLAALVSDDITTNLTKTPYVHPFVLFSHLLSSNGDHIAQLSSLPVNLNSIVQELFERSGIEDAVLDGDVAVDHELNVLLLG